MAIKDRILPHLLFIALAFVRGLVWLKPHIVSFVLWMILPSRILWEFLLFIFIPVYGILFSIKKKFSDLYIPARNRFMYIIVNRHTVHAVIVSILFITLSSSIYVSRVRAEAFGENSLMYSIVVDNENRITSQDIVFDAVKNEFPITYMDSYVDAPTYGALSESVSEADLFANSSSLNAPQVTQVSESIAPRSEVITYLVMEGDTLSGIANKFNISLNTLLWANNLSLRDSIRLGRELTILPVSGVLHKVKKGDTILKIAKQYNVKVEEINSFNNLGSDGVLSVGTILTIPGGEIRTIAKTPSSIGRNPFTSPPSKNKNTGGGSGTGSMMWPTDLRTITSYFTWKHPLGIDIDCHFKNDNYAADGGTVLSSGWSGGYGYSVDIDHGNGIVTRYGHHASLYVKAGETVSRGQPIGRCGTTGKSTGTHLHFEVIVNGKRKNPLEYIR